MLTKQRIGVVGSREFHNWLQLSSKLDELVKSPDDEIISGGAIGADSMAQRYAKERGHDIHIYYPKYTVYGKPATFIRNKLIAENSDLVVAFYQKGRFQLGGTSNTIYWAKELGVPYEEYEEG
jgi:predicted Rossmann fold nucleotide-binding protein DprA/Smf involved in DNA uptake